MGYRIFLTAGAFGIFGLANFVGAQSVASETVVATGMGGAGGGYTFASLDAHFAYLNGEIAFVADNSAPGFDQGIWTTAPGSDVYQSPIYDGQSAGNSSSSVFGIENLQLSGDGSIEFEDLGFGLSIWTPAGGIVQIAGGGQTPPGIGGSYSLIGQASINSSDNIACNAGISGAGSGVWTNAWGNGNQLVAYTGQTAPSGATYVSFNGLTRLAGTNIFDSATVSSGGNNVAGLYQYTPTGAQTLLQNGLPVAGMPGYTFDGLTIPPYAVNNSGALAIDVHLSSGAQSIMLDTGSGLQPIETTGQTAPGLGGTFGGFGNPVLNNNNTVAYVGNYSIYQALYRQTTGGNPQLLAAQSQIAPDVPGGLTFGSFGDMAIGDTGTVGFLAQLKDPNNSSDNPEALYMAGADGNLYLVAYVGESMDIGPGLGTGTISQLEFASSFWESNEPQAMDGDSLLYEATFTNGDTGLYTADVPEPTGAAVILAATTFFATRRKRRPEPL